MAESEGKKVQELEKSLDKLADTLEELGKSIGKTFDAKAVVSFGKEARTAAKDVKKAWSDVN